MKGIIRLKELAENETTVKAPILFVNKNKMYKGEINTVLERDMIVFQWGQPGELIGSSRYRKDLSVFVVEYQDELIPLSSSEWEIVLANKLLDKPVKFTTRFERTHKADKSLGGGWVAIISLTKDLVIEDLLLKAKSFSNGAWVHVNDINNWWASCKK